MGLHLPLFLCYLEPLVYFHIIKNYEFALKKMKDLQNQQRKEFFTTRINEMKHILFG